MRSINNLSGTQPKKQNNSSSDPETKMLSVGDHYIRVLIAGKQFLSVGMPTVVFENGLGESIEGWGSLLARVAEFAPVIAYDRPGIGESKPSEFEPSPANVAALLHNILELLGFDPPFILVGFSLGGPYVRMFAATYPEDITGIVYIDSADFTQTKHDSLQVFADIGSGPEALNEYEQVVDTFVRESQDEQSIAEWEQVKILREDSYSEFNIHAPPLPIPQVILTSSKEVPPLGKYTFDFTRWAKLATTRRTARFMAWAMSLEEGHFVATPSSPHMIHGDDPDLVVWAIRRVMFPDPSKRLKELLQAEDEEAFLAGYHHLKTTYPIDAFREGLLNNIGYGFLFDEKPEKALIAFKLNVVEFPDAANPYDSLAETYMVLGNNELAIFNYNRSLELDPKNRNAENKLKELQV
jgi:pimeloyl-ACP methyl ester carboxylesterase